MPRAFVFRDQSPSRVTPAASRPSLVPISGSLKAVATLVETWAVRRAQRQKLRELDPRLLDDIGVGREQWLVEINKPFWRR